MSSLQEMGMFQGKSSAMRLTPENDSKTLGLQLAHDIDRLSGIVKDILAIPFDKA